MYLLTVVLATRCEYIRYYSKWAGVQRAKLIGKCADVVEAHLTNTETGEIVIHYQNQQLVWVEGFGEL